MQFQVPQFIETEDRIIGPLTIKQFLYLAFAGGISFALFFFLNTLPWVLVTFVLVVIAASFAFIKVGGRPLPTIALAALGFYWKPRFFLWQRKKEEEKLPEIKLEAPKEEGGKSRLGRLWQQLQTTKQPIPKREKPIERPVLADSAKSSKEKYEMMRKITGEQEIARRVDYK